MNHTPTPWRVDFNRYDREYRVYRDFDGVRPITNSMFAGDSAKADCEFIVRAVNAHDELVAALRDCVEVLGEWRRKANVRDAKGFHLLNVEAQASKLLHKFGERP